MKKIIIVIQIIIILSLLTLISCQSLQATPEIINYNNKFSEYADYYMKVQNLAVNYGDQITKIADNLNQSNNTEEMCSYYATLLNLYTNYYNEFAKIKTPSIANNAANYHMSLIQLQISRMSSLVEWCNGNNPNYNMEKDSELLSKISDINLKTIEEFENINNYFNQEAERLGLEKPF